MQGELIAGRYRLEELLGAGGMAEVWRAHDDELDRLVAVKLLNPGADRARFGREGRAAAALAHPSVVQVHDVGEADGRPFVVQEYLPGGTLEDRLAAGERVGEEEAERLTRGIAEGLAHAHERGLVHRDLKPANILFDAEGRPKIADFGIARLADAETLTEEGTIIGTAAYISPEQARGEQATPASDVYSVGVIVYRLLAGRLPFEAEHPLEVARMHVEEEPTPLDGSSPLAATALAALAKDSRERPGDGAALLAALGAPVAAAAGRTDEAATVSLQPRRSVSGPRRAALVLAALAGLAGAGVTLALVAFRGTSSQPPPTTVERTTTVSTTPAKPVPPPPARSESQPPAPAPPPPAPPPATGPPAAPPPAPEPPAAPPPSPSPPPAPSPAPPSPPPPTPPVNPTLPTLPTTTVTLP